MILQWTLWNRVCHLVKTTRGAVLPRPQFETENDTRAPALTTVSLRHVDVAVIEARNDGVLHTSVLLAKCAPTPLTILDVVVVVVAETPIWLLALTQQTCLDLKNNS
jgi:hypothetical protein